MQQITGDLFQQNADAICITTNGYINQEGLAVMGRGCAWVASKRVPELPSILAASIKKHGNVVSVLMEHPSQHLLSFPVKPANTVYNHFMPDWVISSMQGEFAHGDMVPGCFATASLPIIRKSCHELVALADLQGYQSVVIPRPGCGNGELEWDEVGTVLNAYLDDRFFVISPNMVLR